MTSPSPDPRIPALAASCERVTTRVGHLEREVAQLVSDVTQLGQLDKPGKKAEPVPDWLGDPASLDVPGLLGWLDQCYLAYDGSDLPTCWAFHPGIVAELAWLWAAHVKVYAAGDPCRVGDWHDRYRPGVVRRIAVATRGCGDLAEHLPQARGDRSGVAVPIGGALTEAQRSRLAGEPLAYPTDEQINSSRNGTNRRTQTRNNERRTT